MTRWKFLLGLFGFVAAAAAADEYIISTFAGGAPPLTPATPTGGSIGAPISVATDRRGNVYFASSDLNVVFKLDSAGAITRAAGNSRYGGAGDGGPAVDAELQLFFGNASAVWAGLAADSGGNLFIADTGNHRIRRVSPDGVITTIAGNGTRGFSGDGGPAVDAQLNYPWGVAVDTTGNLYIVDAFNYRIRKVSTAGIITTVAGGGTLQGEASDGQPATSALLTAWAVAADNSGNIFIADNSSAWNAPRGLGTTRIRKVSPSGVITTVSSPIYGWGLAVDDSGQIYVADGERSIVRISADGSTTVVAGGGASGLGDGRPAVNARLANPSGVAVDTSGNIFVADRLNYLIRKISPEGVITTVAGNGTGRFLASKPYVQPPTDDRPGTQARLKFPRGVAVDSSGSVYIADSSSHRIRKVSPSGTITTVAGTGVEGFSGDGGQAATAQLNLPIAVSADKAGNLFVLDARNYRVRKISADGIITTVAGNGTFGYSGDGGPATRASFGGFNCNIMCGGLVVDDAGNLFIADPGNGVRRVSPEGVITTVVPRGEFFADGPAGVTLDLEGNLYIVGDSGVLKRSPDGAISTLASLYNVLGVAAGRGGDVFITTTTYGGEVPDERVLQITQEGTKTSIAGVGPRGYSGDGGPASNAAMNAPAGIALDGAGNIYVADSGNDVIRVLSPAARSVVPAAVADAASQRLGPVSPGKIVVIYGAGMGPPDLVQNRPADGELGRELAGTRVLFNDIAAPILYTSAKQVAAVVPYGVTGSSVQVTVQYRGEISAPLIVPVTPASPSIFTANQSGVGQAAINAAGGTVNSAAHPARIGEFISLYATGEGQTRPVSSDGRITDSTTVRPVLPVRATVGGFPAVVQFAGAAPGQVAGLMQVNVQIPAGITPGGYVPVSLQVGDLVSRPGCLDRSSAVSARRTSAMTAFVRPIALLKLLFTSADCLHPH
jgi:uncharacterized protein (TIGR03437 family)